MEPTVLYTCSLDNTDISNEQCLLIKTKTARHFATMNDLNVVRHFKDFDVCNLYNKRLLKDAIRFAKEKGIKSILITEWNVLGNNENNLPKELLISGIKVICIEDCPQLV